MLTFYCHDCKATKVHTMREGFVKCMSCGRMQNVRKTTVTVGPKEDDIGKDTGED